jgi:Fic family protein
MDVLRDAEYPSTHPWLTFTVDLRPASPNFWMLLGEARSKCAHIAGVPLRPATSDELHVLYLAKGVNATTAIEGNPLTEEQVRQHLRGELTLPRSQRYLQKELDNIVEAFEHVAASVLAGTAELTPQFLCDLNEKVLQGLELEKGVVPGEVRKIDVGVMHYRGPTWRECPYLLDRLCEWLNGPDFAPREDFGASLDIIKAIVAHLYFVWIHPFGDGNGRTARLIELMILMQAGVPKPASHLLSNHYHLTRTAYYRMLDSARQSNDDVLAFVRYAVDGFVEQLTQQIEVIRRQQMEQAWEDLVDDRLGDRSTPVARRQRLLAVELGRLGEPVAKARMSSLSPALARCYAGKGPKTLTRDVNSLRDLGLITGTAAGWRARTDVVAAFLPVRAGSVYDSMARHPAHRTPAL